MADRYNRYNWADRYNTIDTTWLIDTIGEDSAVYRQCPVVFERPEPQLETVILPPSYTLAWGLGAIALPLALLNRWVSLGMSLFALFLAVQATLLRIHFTDKALELYRGEKRLRTFPYADWTHWEIFWQPLPILFYFNEVNNIHFVPMLFNPQQLRDCAVARCPRLPDSQTDQPGAQDGAPSATATQVQQSAPAKGVKSD